MNIFERINFNAILNNLEMGVMFLDKDKKLLFNNDYVNYKMKFKPEDNKKYYCYNVLMNSKKECKDTICPFSFFKGDENFYNCTKVVNVNGQKAYFNITSFRMKDKKNKDLGLIMIFHDVTKETVTKKKEIEYEKYKFLTETFLNISHEIKNLLIPLIGYSEILKEKHQVMPENKKLLLYDKLCQSSNELKKLVECLRITNIEDEKTIDKIDVDKEISDIVEEFEVLSVLPDMKIEYRSPKKHYYFEGNKNKFNSIFRNFMLNAVECLYLNKPVDPTLKITLSKYSQYYYVKFWDNAGGIKNPRKIFKKFYSEKQYLGTGLGLFNSKRYLLDIGGDIKLRTKRGEWTEFTVKIPIKQRVI